MSEMTQPQEKYRPAYLPTYQPTNPLPTSYLPAYLATQAGTPSPTGPRWK